jgi:hypothetical protein
MEKDLMPLGMSLALLSLPYKSLKKKAEVLHLLEQVAFIGVHL